MEGAYDDQTRNRACYLVPGLRKFAADVGRAIERCDYGWRFARFGLQADGFRLPVSEVSSLWSGDLRLGGAVAAASDFDCLRTENREYYRHATLSLRSAWIRRS